MHAKWLLSAFLIAPVALQPPKEQVLRLHLIGKGKQIYICQTAGGQGAWKLKAPNAKLFSESGDIVGRHYGGPTWEANDHSRITGKVIASIPSPDDDAIPWLLLTVVSHEGTGVFSQVQSIQRLDTKGGAAPAKNCNAGDQTDVPYQANYYFWGTSKE
jgi:hypothetical protein